MIHRLIAHLRGQWLGAIALFIALGGTSYAAVSIPRNSVGTEQLRNRAVTSKKLAKGSVVPKTLKTSAFGGQILFSAQVSAIGKIISSQPKGASAQWSNQPSDDLYGGTITWHRAIPRNCFALGGAASTVPFSASTGVPYATASIQTQSQAAARLAVTVRSSALVPVDVVVVCPSAR